PMYMREKSADSPSGRSSTGFGRASSWGLLAAVVVAFTTGLAHASIVAWTRGILHRITWEGPDLAWMAPLAYLMQAIAAAAIGAAAGIVAKRFWPSLNLQRVIAGALLFLAVLSLLIVVGHLRPWAQIVLALAVAVRANGSFSRIPVTRLARVAG